jgi:hypothetical protein
MQEKKPLKKQDNAKVKMKAFKKGIETRNRRLEGAVMKGAPHITNQDKSGTIWTFDNSIICRLRHSKEMMHVHKLSESTCGSN